MSALLNEAKKTYKQHQTYEDAVHNLVVFDKDTYILTINNKIYKPNPTALKYHANNSMVRAITGPYGSGKTIAACADIVMQAILIPPCIKNYRKSKFVIVRNTYAELTTTTIPSWIDWFDDLGVNHLYAKSPFEYNSTFFDQDGRIEIIVLFLALDKPKDLKKLKSLEITSAVLEEASELESSVLTHLIGRRRYPAYSDMECYFYQGITLVTNCPSEDHWFYYVFEVQKPNDFAIFHQPPGLIKDENDNWVTNPNADNVENLSKNYYADMANSASADFINVYCLGKYGIVSNQTPVYIEYNDDMHVSDKLEYLPELPIQLGWDFGLTPACVILQILPNGCINILDEVVSVNTGLDQFINNYIIPFLNKHYGDYSIEWSVGDPAGRAGDPITNRPILSTIKSGHFMEGIMADYGFPTEAATTNALMVRLDTVKGALTKLIDLRPQLMISKRCKTLRQGFVGHYYLVGDTRSEMANYEPRPCKNFYSHIQDALQYAILKAISNKNSSKLNEFEQLNYTIIK